MTQVTHLTTALQSNAGSNFVQANAVFAGTNATGTIASNGISVSVAAPVAQTAFQFSNANGVSFGTNGSTVTASVQTNYQAPGAYLTTAALSDHSHGNPTLALTNINGTTASNSNGLTLSLSAAGGAGDGYNIVGVNGNTVGSANTIQFSNSNNVTFGLNGSTITASASYVNDLTSGRAGVGETVGTIAGTDLAMTVNTDGVSVGYPKWITTYAAQSVQPVAVSGSNGSFNFSTLPFVTGNGATFYTDATGMRLSYSVPGATVFSNSNNVSFGLNGSTITATATFPAGGGDAIRGIAVAGATLTTNTVNFSNANGVSFGLGAGANSTVMTASYASDHSHGNPTLALTNLGGTTASASNGFTLSLNNTDDHLSGWSLGGNTLGTNSTGLATEALLHLAGGANITLSGNSNTITIVGAAAGGGVTMQGGYSNLPYFTGTVTLGYGQSTSHVVPFQVGDNLSFDYIRIQGLPVVSGASTTAATAANTTFSVGYTKTHNLALYSIAQGANSDSLQLYRSTQFLEYFSGRIGAGAASANGQVYTNQYTLPCSSGNSGFTYNYSSTAASFNVNSAGITGLTGTKFIEIPFGTSVTPGRWFLMYGYSTTTAVQAAGTTIGLRNAISYNPIFMSQANQSIGVWGAATSNIYGPQQGLGSFTTVGGATTASLHVTKVTVSAAHPQLYFHLMRSA